VEEILKRKRLVCYLQCGAGKTLIALGVFMRIKFDHNCDLQPLMVADGICLVVTEANLIESVWVRQAWDHGVFSHIGSITGANDPGIHKQLMVVSFQTLAIGAIRTFLDTEAGTLWGRKIVAVIVDEEC